MEQTGLIKFDAAIHAIEQAKNVDEVKAIRDKAEACRIYAKQVGISLDGQNSLAEIRLRAERKAGVIIKEMEKAKGAADKGWKTQSHDVTTLEELGVTPMQSSRWQLESELSEHDFSEHIKKIKRSKCELTSKDIQRLARSKKIDDERDNIAKKGRTIKKSDQWTVECCDIKTYKINKQFDYIITDPPYSKEYISLYSVLAEKANEWLVNGGLLIAMCGQSYLAQIYERMSEYLEYYWTGCYLTPGQTKPLRAKQVNTNWKALLFFIKPNDKYTGKIFGDVFKSDANDKSFHKWGQSESGMLSIISKVCLPGQTIFDPFLGAGTTGIAAKRHGCLFHGIDIDKECVDLSKGRLANDSAT